MYAENVCVLTQNKTHRFLPKFTENPAEIFQNLMKISGDIFIETSTKWLLYYV